MHVTTKQMYDVHTKSSCRCRVIGKTRGAHFYVVYSAKIRSPSQLSVNAHTETVRYLQEYLTYDIKYQIIMST